MTVYESQQVKRGSPVSVPQIRHYILLLLLLPIWAWASDEDRTSAEDLADMSLKELMDVEVYVP
jgi:hypothetical protein